MPIHDVETCGDNMIADWVRLKRREQRMRRIRKCAELLVELKYTIHWAHKENTDESRNPVCWQPQNWKKTLVKKENCNTPLILVKEELITPCLQYPVTNKPFRYTSLDPNDFDWGDGALVD